jgi:hypothetical protein
MSYLQSDEPKEKGAKSFKIGVVLLLLATITSTLAANISVNQNNRLEFGQGVYTVAACNGWIQIEVSYGETVGGYSAISGFVLQGIDPVQCASSTLTFKFFEATDPPTLLPLYATTSESPTPEDKVSQVSLAIDSSGNVLLVDPNFTPIEEDSPYISISRDETTSNYIVGFNYPQSNMEDLDNITVESGPNGL